MSLKILHFSAFQESHIEGLSTICASCTLIFWLITIWKGSNSLGWVNRCIKASLGWVTPEIETSPGKQPQKSVQSWNSKPHRKKKKKGAEPQTKNRSQCHRGKKTTPPLLFSPTLLLWDWQKALDYKHQGPTHKTIKQLQSFHRPPTSALRKVCASQQSWNAKNPLCQLKNRTLLLHTTGKPFGKQSLLFLKWIFFCIFWGQ